MKKKLAVVMFTLFILTSCNSGNNEGLDKLESDVMLVHDEVMPKMGEIMELRSKLSEKLSLVDSTSNQYTIAKAKTDSLTSLLETADNGMMDWMENYNADTLKTIDATAGAAYLNDQKTKISIVKDLTNKNIEAVKAYLK